MKTKYIFLILLTALCGAASAQDPVNIGNRRELFVDRFLIDQLNGVRLQLHTPREEGLAFAFDKPWEGPFSGYVTMVRLADGRLRAYYRGKPVASRDGSEDEVTCVAESTDGRNWTKPELGLYEAHGTKANSIVLMNANQSCTNFTPFRDTRPGVPEAERFKAFGGTVESGIAAWKSADGYRWERMAAAPVMSRETVPYTGTFPARVGSGLKPYPFGSIVHGADGSLRTVVYSVDEKHANAEAAWLMASRDEGRSWQTSGKIADGINETVLRPLAGRGWLCVARISNRPAPEHGQELRQFRSSDDGKTWTDEGLLTGFHKHPPNLIRLKDNRLVLTYGNRQNGNIEARLSNDDGKSWGAPLRLFQASGDMGYPSTVQLSDGRLVTVFYAHRSVMHDGYHMGAVGWQAPQESNGTDR